MATKKTDKKPEDETLWDMLESLSDEREKNLVKRKWQVYEFRNEERDDDNWQNVIDYGVNRPVTKELDSEEEAVAWTEEYDPAENTRFIVRRVDYYTSVHRQVL